MPMLIEHIDAIARQKKRDVIFLSFVHASEPDEQSFLKPIAPTPIRCAAT